MSDYQPIDCGVHSELELLAMHRAQANLEIRQADDKIVEIYGRVLDVFAKQGAEYLRLATEEGELNVRLDRILWFKSL